MTEEEFLMSLPQEMHNDEKKARWEKWKQENPQPEVEEETVEEEVVEEPQSEEPDVDLLNYQFQNTNLVPSLFGEPAGTPPQSTVQLDKDGNLSINPNNLFNRDYSNLSLSGINTLLQPQQQNQDYLEAIEKLSVVAKPEEVIKERDHEYKYEITDDNKLVYYTRRVGSKDFIPIQKGDKYYEEISGRVFKHFDFPEDQYNQANKVLKTSKKLTNSMFETLNIEAGTITGMGEPEIPEEFIQIAEQFEDEVEINDEDREQINEDAMNFVLNNSKIDETKKGVNVLAKGGSSGVYEYKTGKKIDNPEWSELNEAAIKQYAKENKINPEDVDVSDPNVEKAIFDIMASNKAVELTDKLQKRKMTNFIENQPSDFSWKKLGTWLYSELAMPVDVMDAEDVWSVNDLQRNMEAFQKWKQSNVNKQSKDIGNFIKKAENFLILTQDVSEKIQNGQYTTSAQLAAANKELKNLNKLRKQTFDLLNTKYEELNLNAEKSKDLAADINLLERNFNVIPLITNNIENSSIEMLQGIEEIMFQAVNLPNNLPPDAKQAFQLFNPAWSIINNLGIIGNWSDYRKDYNKRIDAYQEDIMSGVAEMGTFDDIENMDDFGRYYASMFGSVLPQAVAMIGTGGYGLGAVVLSSGGGKWKEMESEMKASQDVHKLWEQRKPKKGKLESEEDYKKRLATWSETEPAVIDYNMAQMWGGALTNMAIEGTAGYFISLPLSQGKSFMQPLLNRVKAFNSPAVKKGFSTQFANILKPTAAATGDILIEGAEEGLVGVGNNIYDRIFLGKDVNIFEGFKDNIAGGIIGGKIFKAPALFKPYLSMSQTPGDVSNITGYQNQIKSIANTIAQNPEMSVDTRNILNSKIGDLTLNINNSITNSLNRYTQMPVETISLLGNIEQQMFSTDQKIEAVQNDDGIQVGKEQLIEDLQNEKNNLTGEKNRILESYVTTDAEGQVTGGNLLIAPIRKGAEAVAEQLGDTDIVRFDTTQDFIGGIETLRSEGIEVELAQDAQGNTLPAAEQSYGIIATLPDGTKQVIINNASQEADGVIPADKHEVLHAFAAKMDPEVKSKMGEDLYNLIVNDTGDITSRVEIDPRTKASLDTYRQDFLDGNISEPQFYEEVMAVVSDGLTQGTVKIKETGPIMNLVNKFLETIGFKQNFDDGKQVLDFLKDFNKDVLSGQGLSQQTLDRAGVNLDQEVDMGLETEVDLGVVQSKKGEVPDESDIRTDKIMKELAADYMDTPNNILQQGLISELSQTNPDQNVVMPIAQAVVEKNWGLISPLLNYNKQSLKETNTAKRIILDQLIGEFKGSGVVETGSLKHSPRNTSALQGYSLDPTKIDENGNVVDAAAQVSTYLAETIKKRKPEIDAAIVDELRAGVEVNPAITEGAVTQTETTETETTRPLPSETTKYSDAILETVQTDKGGLETRITESVQQSYPGRTDVTLAETRNIPEPIAQVYAEMFGLNPQTLSDKTRNFQKTDADGLNAAKRFLIDNAQADFANLPDALDIDGKGTFIPLNVKKALYTDGKKTGTLKDYLEVIRIKPEKPIYRDRTGQTIRGLLNLHIRNRILETGNPDAASRKKSGAKFSKRPEVKSTRVDNRTPNQVLADMGRGPMRIQTAADGSLVVDSGPVERLTPSGRTFPKVKRSAKPKITRADKTTKKVDVKEVVKLEETAVDQTVSEIAKAEPIPTISYQKLEKDLQPGNIKDKVYTGLRDQNAPYKKDKNGKTIETYEQARNRVVNDFLDKHPKWKSFIRRGMSGGIENSLFLSTQEYRLATANVPASTQTDILPSSIGTKVSDTQGSNKLNPKGLRDFNKDNEALKPETLIEFWGDVADFLQGNEKDAWFFAELVNDSRNHTAGPLRSAAAYAFYPINPNSKKPNFEVPILIEHGMPNFAANKPLFAAAMKGRNYVNALKDVTVGSYGQGAIMNDTTKDKELSDDDLVNVDFKNTMPDWFYRDVIPTIKSGKLNDIIEKYPGIIGPAARMAAAGVNQNFYASPVDGKTIPEILLGMKIPENNLEGPNSVEAINEAIQNRLSGMDIADVQKILKYKLQIALDNTNATDKSLVQSGPEVFDPNMTVEKMKTVAINSLNTRVLASKRTPKPKGISVFDFDDTLAKTKEKVIVIMPDGKRKEISAAEFAKEAANLTEAGATFDFSNFENVASDTAEGPLADLARKRQGKFGSGDIFVLTARPAEAAPAIQQFLKSIGIDIPLANITGLGDGSPQAKVDFILNKTAEGYNDFYFADDSFANVKAVSQILDAIDVKNTVEQAQTKEVKLNNDMNQLIEEVTGVKSFKQYSTVRARLEGKKKDGGILKRIGRQFTITYSAEDFEGLTYALRGKGEQGNKHAKFIQDNLIDPYNKAELELLTAKVNVGRDFAALRKKFPSLRGSKVSLTNPLLKEIDGGPFNKEQAVRVYLWNKQGMEIPDMSKRDVNRLVKAVEADIELKTFADELSSIQRGPEYPGPGKNWLGGSIKNDILSSMDGSFRSDLMAEFNENVDIIFNPQTLNKLEAIYGTKYVEALKDSIRRMKSGSNRPKITGSGARVVNEMLDWLNASVANVMFLNMRSGLLQTLSTVNFINWGDNNIYAASKAFASKEMWPTFMRLMNSDYLVNRRDGLRINVNEAELADAAKKGGIKGAFSYLLDKGFAITRIMDSFAIALGGSTFFINRKKALLNRVNPDTGKLYTEAEADAKAFLDFYDIAEQTQQSSNPSKISSQQASIAGRLLLSFQNITMQMNRKTKRAVLDLYNRRKKPGMTQRESDLSNMSNIVYYVGMQNLIFNGLQQGLFAMLFDEEEEDERKEERLSNTVNGMVDSLLFGLGFGGAIVATSKNILRRIADESDKNKPDYRDIPDDVFDVSSVIDAKLRKLQSAARTFTFERDEIKRRGWSLDNPAYLAVAQIIAAVTNAPIDRTLMKINNLRQASDESVRMWQRVALVMGWSGWQFGLPYWGRQSTIEKEAKEDEKIKINYQKSVKEVKAKGFTKKIPLSGPNHYKPTGELGVDYMQVERPDGTIQYYVKHKK